MICIRTIVPSTATTVTQIYPDITSVGIENDRRHYIILYSVHMILTKPLANTDRIISFGSRYLRDLVRCSDSAELSTHLSKAIIIHQAATNGIFCHTSDLHLYYIRILVNIHRVISIRDNNKSHLFAVSSPV